MSEDLAPELWPSVLPYVRRPDLASLRATCRALKREIDGAVTRIHLAVGPHLPRLQQFPKLQVVEVVDEVEGLAICVSTHMKHCHITQQAGKLEGVRLAVSGQSWWQSDVLQGWLGDNQSLLAGVNLALRMSEDHQAEDVSAVLNKLLDGTVTACIKNLWLWCEREAGAVLATDLYWHHPVPWLRHIEGLYVEFMTLKADVFVDMPALKELYIVLEDWEVLKTAALGSIPSLEVLTLEPDAPLTLDPNIFLEFGPHITTLRLLGPASIMSFREEPDWEIFITSLFVRLGNLQCFEATRDAWPLACNAYRRSRYFPGDRDVRDDVLLCRFANLWVVLDRQGHSFKGVLRTPEAMKLLSH